MRAAGLALVLASCASATMPGTMVGGNWGGPHVALTVGQAESRLEFDCAAGTISGPLRTAPGGRFDWPGNFTRGTGGPVRIGLERAPQPARYLGIVRGSRMTLTVRLADGTLAGPFTLERLRPALLTRCL